MTIEYDITDLPNDIRNAADIIARDGWCKHELVSQEGQVCAFGAIARSIEERLAEPILIESGPNSSIVEEFQPHWQKLASTINIYFRSAQPFFSSGYLADFNDRANSSQEVQKVLHDIADKIEFPDA